MIRGVRPQETVTVTVTTRTGEELSGTFTWQRRRILDLGAIAAEQSRLTGGQQVVLDEMKVIIAALAELRVMSIAGPEWWKDELDDVNLLLQVWNQYTNWRDSFRPKSSAATPAPPDAGGVNGDAERGHPAGAHRPGPGEPGPGLPA